MFDLAAHLNDTLWLAEPTRLRLAVAHLSRLRDWPTARAVAKERRRRLERARAAAEFAVQSTGVSDPGEAQLPKRAAAQALRAVKGKVGVVPIHGPVDQRVNCATMMLGGTSCEEAAAMLDSLMADKSVEAVVLHCDSPGGGTFGIEELGDEIHDAAAKKPIYSSSDSLCASACYWLASQAGHLSVTPGGEVGAVGVFMVHADQTQADADQGLKVSVIRAGRYKAEGIPHEPLSPEARDYLQSQVDYTYGKFLAAVARGRGTSAADVRANYGEGRVLNADDALAAGMVDRVLTFDDLMGKLTGGRGMSTAALPRGIPSGAFGLDVLRRRHAVAVARTAPLLPKRAGPGLTHDSKTRADEPSWGGVDKTRLPDNAFADETDRSYPHHWVEGGSDPDEKGRYTKGSLWLHRGGLNAAWAAAQGAHTGKKASAAIIAHLERHRAALGLDKDD